MMVCLALVFAAVIIKFVHGRPPLPPLPTRDGCFLVSPEVEIFRVEGEAMILSFPIFQRVLKVRNIASSTAKYLITRDNSTAAYEGEGRVQQHDRQLWLLPAQASDSGEYTCSYRNDTYCITGSITIHVYEPGSLDMRKLSYPVSATVGEELTLRCPSLNQFNKTESEIEWYLDSSPTALQLGRLGSFRQARGKLLIPAVKRSDAGLYFCQLRVLMSNQQYKVSRAILLHVQGPDCPQTTTLTDVHLTSDPGLSGSSSSSAPLTPALTSPVIISPLNGTIFEGPHGSGLELFCVVLTGCEMAESTMVTWLVNSQSVESSYLDGRALQGGRRETRVSNHCQIEMRLVIMAMTEEDTKTELKCVSQNQGGRQEVVTYLQLEDSTFTWLVVAVVAVSCCLTVVSVFLYLLFKPKQKKRMDYFLARQNSTF